MWFEQEISRIEELLADDNKRSYIYAALECRLLIEQIAYQRFEQSASFTNSRLVDWKPKQILDSLINEVGKEVVVGFTLSISKDAHQSKPATASDSKELDYEVIGTQSGINVRQLGRFWNALSAYLHYQHGENRKDEEQAVEQIWKALRFIKEIAEGSLIMGSFLPRIKFPCSCGDEMPRVEEYLKENQLITCNNPACFESYTVKKKDGVWGAERRATIGACNYCGENLIVPGLYFDRLRGTQHLYFDCPGCGERTVGVLERTLKQKEIQS